MPLRVLHVLIPEPPGELGGADMHVRDLVAYQSSADLAPTVIERGSAEFADRLRSLGVGVVSATGLGFRPAVSRLAVEIADSRPDVVHAHGYDADYWAAAVRWRHPRLFRNRSLVFTQHGVVEDTLWHRGKTWLDAVCTRSADGVIVCAEGLTDRMRRWCPTGPVRYIPNGVDAPVLVARTEARRRFGLPADGFVVGYVGRLSAEKRPDRVLTLVADARESGLPIHGLIAGSGPLRTQLERQAHTRGVGEAVVFAGLVRAIGTVYGAIDALALLSDTEATSRVVIETMACGVPVLASAVGGVPELLDHGRAGYLIPPGDAEAALAALRQLVADPVRFVEPARQRARASYLAPVMGRRVTEFYQDLRARAVKGEGSAAIDS